MSNGFMGYTINIIHRRAQHVIQLMPAAYLPTCDQENISILVTGDHADRRERTPSTSQSTPVKHQNRFWELAQH